LRNVKKQKENTQKFEETQIILLQIQTVVFEDDS
jgi:hypothetical protein